MHLAESARTSFEEIKAHPLRSLFTLVGVILGTLALVVVLSVLNGIEVAVWQGVEDLGLDGVLVMNQRTPPTKCSARSSTSRAACAPKTRIGSQPAI